MAKKPSASTATATGAGVANVVTLAMIVAAGAEGMYTAAAVHGPLVEKGLVEINPAMTNEAGEVATRATQAGIDEVNGAEAANTNANGAGSNESGNMQAAAAVRSAFGIDDGIPMPTASGRGRGGNTYPFDQLGVGQSFFVPNTEDKPNAAKSLASTVSSATARYCEVIEGQFKTNGKGEQVPATRETRKFVVRPVDETAQGRGKGARVWRTA